ncbi:hypothetical protein [Methylobacter svalbardensis]|uniref:hypothetical protein n=1 Tax=Methylobacter svalbardensis TaxID=3080016 RepID=UPI0030ECCA07
MIDKPLMMVSTVGVIVIVTIITSIALLLMFLVIIALAGDGIVLIMTFMTFMTFMTIMLIMLIMIVMMWRIGSAMASFIMIWSFAVIVSVHNGISAAITSIIRIIRMLLWMMGTSGKQQRKTDEQYFFNDGIHAYSP